MSEENKQAEFILIWTDDDEGAVPVRDQYRDLGHRVSIRDARFFAPNSVEAANRLVFIGAGKRDEIIAAYRSEHYRREWGDVAITDVPLGKMGEAIAVPKLPRAEGRAPAPTGEADALDAQTAAMSDDDLRKFVKGITGKMPKQTATREVMMKALRAHQGGRQDQPATEEELQAAELELAPAAVSDANAAPPAETPKPHGGGDI